MDIGRTVFILHMGPNGLGVTRSLGWNGIKIVGVDYVSGAIGLHSKYVHPLLAPSPVKKSEELLETLLKEASKYPYKPVLICCSDEYVLFVSRNRRRLSEAFEFNIPSEYITESMVDKSHQYRMATKVGIPIPYTIFPRSMADIRDAKDTLRYPCFIKPFYSHLWYTRFGNKGFIIKSYQELCDKFEKALEADLQVLVQNIVGVPGKDLYQVCAYFGKDGYISPRFVWYKARQSPPSFGVASLGVSVKNEQVEELGLKFLKGIEYQGMGSAEFKFDPADGVYRLIELNLRTWMQNVMCAVAGLNLPLIQYLDLTNQERPEAGVFSEGVRWWDALADLDSFVRLRRRGELRTLKWLKSWIGSDCYAYYSPEDIGPAIARSGYGVNVLKTLTQALRRPIDEDDTQLGRKR